MLSNIFQSLQQRNHNYKLPGGYSVSDLKSSMISLSLSDTHAKLYPTVNPVDHYDDV